MRRLLLLYSIFAILAAAPGVVLAADGPPSPAIRVQPAEILDRSGFEKPLVAATVMMPVGWKAEGGVSWQQNTSGCGRNTPHFAWRATSPDGRSAIEILPEETWSGNNFQMPGTPAQACPNVWLESARQYLEAWVQEYRSGARTLEYRDRPDFVKQVNDQIARKPQMPIAGTDLRQWAEGGQVLIGYERAGVAMKEIIGIPVLFNSMRMQGVYPGEVQATLTTTTMPGFAMRAPAAEFDERRAEMLRKSGRGAPEWQARIARHNAKIGQIQAKGARDRARIIAETGDEIREMQSESWKRQNESRDRMQREASESIRGTETYNDPTTGGTVELDSSYEHAWQLNDGSYILTDDASFEPFSATGQQGRRLEVTP